MRLALVLSLIAAPALADVAAVVDDHILPGSAAFARAGAVLADAAAADCLPAALDAPWNAAMDAWLGIAHLRIGPQEQAALTIAFWPDARGSGRRALARLAVDGAAGLALAPAPARGLHALDTMLHDPEFNGYAPGSPACALVVAMTADLAAQAQALDAGWRAYAPVLLTAGAPGNAVYLSPAEAQRALFTQLHGGVEFNADQRLGQPLGTPDRPRPARAENARAGRSLRNLTLSMEALHRMARALIGGPDAAVDQAFDSVAFFAGNIADPGFQDITDPQARLRLEALQGRVRAVGDVLIARVGEALGIAPGFNSLDGD